jgi:uncharacterized lipoprotein
MRMIVLAAAAVMLASCSTGQTTATNASNGQQASTTNERDTPRPPAFRVPRQRSGNGWPDIGYRPHGY